MKILVLTALIAGLTACATGPKAPFQSTVDLIEAAGRKCRATVKNDAQAQKDCFPALKDQRLLIRATRVFDEAGVRKVDGVPGKALTIVRCEVAAKTAYAIDQRAQSITVGNLYWVKGDFTNYLRSVHQYYTLSACTIEPYVDAAVVP